MISAELWHEGDLTEPALDRAAAEEDVMCEHYWTNVAARSVGQLEACGAAQRWCGRADRSPGQVDK